MTRPHIPQDVKRERPKIIRMLEHHITVEAHEPGAFGWSLLGGVRCRTLTVERHPKRVEHSSEQDVMPHQHRQFY